MIKILVSTNETQGQRENDFCFVTEGEIVTFGALECRSDECGCERALVGAVQGQRTTTMRVVEWNGSLPAFAQALRQVVERDGMQEAVNMAQRIYRITMNLPLWAVVERRGAEIVVRKVA